MKRGVRNLEFVLQQMHPALMALTTNKVDDSVVNSRKKPLEAWRRLQKRYDPDDKRKKAEMAWHDHFFWMVRSVGTPSRDRTMGILRVALRENLEGHNQTMRSSSLPLKAVVLEEQLEPLANVRGRAPGNRDVCGGEVLFERPRFQAK